MITNHQRYNQMMKKEKQQSYDKCMSDSDNNSNSDASSEDSLSIDDNVSIEVKINRKQNFNVICAKGAVAYNNAGNIRFRQIVKQYLGQYDTARGKNEKSKVVTAIIEDIRIRGDFVKQDAKTGTSIPASNRLTREKVGQGLRDALHKKYKSSAKAKKRQRLAERNKQDDLVSQIVSSNDFINDTLSYVVNKASTTKSETHLMQLFVDANKNILQQLKDSNCANLLASLENKEEPEDIYMPLSFTEGEDDIMEQSLSLFEDDEFRTILQSLLKD